MSLIRRGGLVVECIDHNGGALEEYALVRAFKEYIDNKEGATPMAKALGDIDDRKTRATLLNSLEERGLVKRTKVKAPSRNMSAMVRTIIYKPGIDPAVLQSYIGHVVSGEALPSPLRGKHPFRGRDVGPLEVHVPESPWSSSSKLKATEGGDIGLDSKAREFYANQPHIRSQYYGYFVGSLSRLRRVHIHMMQLLQGAPQSSSAIVSEEARVFDISYFWTNAPLRFFTAVVTTLRNSDKLKRAVDDPQLRDMPITSQAQSIQFALHLGRTHCSIPFHRYMRSLHVLGLAEPVEKMGVTDEAASGEPSFGVVVKAAFDHTLWRLRERVPLHQWSLRQTNKPVVADLPMGNMEQALAYWDRLKEVSLSSMNEAEQQVGLLTVQKAETTGPTVSDARLARSIIRPANWSERYSLASTQQKFLARYLDDEGRSTVLGDTSMLSKLSDTCMAPLWVVRRFFERRAERSSSIAHENNYNRRQIWKDRHFEAQEKALHRKRARETIARKAREAQENQEREWQKMLDLAFENSPEASDRRTEIVTALEPFHKRFLRNRGSVKPVDIQTIVQAAVNKATQPAHPAPAFPKSAVIPRRTRKPRQSRAKPQNTVADLPRDEESSATHNAGSNGRRRKRNTREKQTWTRELDELLRDACVILRSRNREQPRKNWMALLQIFPQRNGSTGVYSKRFDQLKQAIGEEAYLDRLEAAWHELWRKYRCTEVLPDEDPSHPTAFSLQTHVDFLRANIDKPAILTALETVAPEHPLPFDSEQFAQEWHDEKADVQPERYWDMLWSDPVTSAATARSKLMSDTSLTMYLNRPLPRTVRMEWSLAESVVKVRFAHSSCAIGSVTDLYFPLLFPDDPGHPWIVIRREARDQSLSRSRTVSHYRCYVPNAPKRRHQACRERGTTCARPQLCFQRRVSSVLSFPMFEDYQLT